ncbi:protein no-on-transient A-like [Salarias fasciatus]|uniref:protein no-on-transient A-like n=1 Tax=Salarias fasciatus TaxID=181472 RepID=UPI001176C13B|nr:protein no-on-transient A-like [Salarias fasciatus]
MHRPSSPPNPSDGASAVKDADCSGGDPQPAGAAGASAQTSRANNGGNPISAGGGGGGGIGAGAGGGEPDSTKWCGTDASLGVHRNKPKLHPSRRSSSGYISDCDSQPSSPLFPKLPTADKATQTRSLTGQVMTHAVHRMAEQQGGGAGTHQRHGHAPNPLSTRRGNAAAAAADMQAEQVGRELRLIGDDYNRLLLLRRVAGGHRQPGIPLNLLPHIQQEPVALLCVSLLLVLLGRIMYLQGTSNSPDHSQV